MRPNRDRRGGSAIASKAIRRALPSRRGRRGRMTAPPVGSPKPPAGLRAAPAGGAAALLLVGGGVLLGLGQIVGPLVRHLLGRDVAEQRLLAGLDDEGILEEGEFLEMGGHRGRHGVLVLELCEPALELLAGVEGIGGCRLVDRQRAGALVPL